MNAFRSVWASFTSLVRISYLADCFSLSVLASSFFRAANLLASICSFSRVSLRTPDDPEEEVSERWSEKALALVTSLESILPSALLSFILTRVRPLAGSDRAKPPTFTSKKFFRSEGRRPDLISSASFMALP